MQLELGLDVIRSYKRLSYTPWHAIAEFVDNSTQSYLNHRKELDAATEDTPPLEVSIAYDRARGGLLRVADNAMGMSADELEIALHVGARPADTSGRCKFGMGMKTSACWIGNRWTVRTKRLGETAEHKVTVDVEEVAAGRNTLPHQTSEGKDPKDHYTIIEVEKHNQLFHGRTLGKIREFLGSMYRQDLMEGFLNLVWQGESLEWHDVEDQLLQARDGSRYQKRFEFHVNGKRVWGWVGILDRGSRAKAGFSILYANRVVRGWPDSWRPESVYGQFLGSNDLVNQRVIGEIHLDEFQVSQAKDDILWLGNEEDEVQDHLKSECAEYVAVAKTRRKGGEDERGVTDVEIQTAVEEIQQELTSAELADLISIEAVPPPNVVSEGLQPLLALISSRDPTYAATIDRLAIRGYLADEMSPNDPYVVVDATTTNRVVVIVNLSHPHIQQIVGSEGFLNYLRHCTYDALAEWQARHKASTIDPDTIKLLKDKLLRIPLEIEMHALAAEPD